jgi:hypothetical protein
MRRPAAALALSLVLATPAAADVLATGKVGNWELAAHSAEGRFSHCTATAPFGRNLVVGFVATRDGDWEVRFTARALNLVPGAKVPVALGFDDAAPEPTEAVALSRDTLRVDLPANPEAFQAVLRIRTLRLLHGGASYAATERETLREILSTLLDCVKGEIRNTYARQGEPAQDFRAETRALMAKLLPQTGLKNVRILPPEPGQDGVMWDAGDVKGQLFVDVDRNATAAQSLQRGLTTFRRACDDAAAARSELLPDDTNGAQARAVLVCRMHGASLVQYFLEMPRRQGGHYVFVTYAQRDEPASRTDARIRAALAKALAE